jgi:hypothetical protein
VLTLLSGACGALIRFEEYAIKEIEKAKEAGKPLHMLLRALQFQAEPLLPSKLNKKANRKLNPDAGKEG